MMDILSLQGRHGRKLKSNRYRIYIFVFLLPFLLAGCTRSFQITLAKGSTNKNLVFYISDPFNPDAKIRLADFTVYRAEDIYYRKNYSCYPPPEDAMWSITAKSVHPREVTDIIVYGKNRSGMKVEKSALPIEKPGAYLVHAYAEDKDNMTRIATLGFIIKDNGEAYEMSDDESDKLCSR
jgi:hypothetical protein